jgi:dTDP-4-amino-4,6-dideoxygalactose transaminase
MQNDFLHFSPPDIGEEEIAEVIDCLRSGWITTGPRVQRFEEEFAAYVGAESALAVNSGTAAIHCGLATFGIGPGDAVVVPTMTFSSAVASVEHVGARPIFVDVEPDSLNVDVARVEAALDRGDVRCILPVHLYGLPCDMPALLDLAEAAGATVLDDAAHALPATVNGMCVGGSGRADVLTAFSFYATKNLTTGEGGMLTGTTAAIDQAREWSLHGMSRDAWRRYEKGAVWRYDVTRAGFKYNMSDIQAALGLVQLRRLPQMHARRAQIASRYASGLALSDAVQLPAASDHHAWHIYAIRLRLEAVSIDRDAFIEELRLRNIGASVHFIPVHTLTYYRDKYGFHPDDFPVASHEFERLISLPIHSRLTDGDVDRVVEAVADVAARHRR